MNAPWPMLVSMLALFLSPGPATMSLAATGAAYGPRRGGRYLAGIITGTLFDAVLIATGLVGVLFALPAARGVLTIVASAYILYLAWKIATARPLREAEPGDRPPGFTSGFMLAITNPKAFAAIGAIFAGYTIFASSPITDVLFKIGVLFVIILAGDWVWLAAGALLAQMLRSERAGRILNICFALALILSVAALLPAGA